MKRIGGKKGNHIVQFGGTFTDTGTPNVPPGEGTKVTYKLKARWQEALAEQRNRARSRGEQASAPPL
jgi:hypothetical protein